MKEYYRLIEYNPPDLETIKLLLEEYGAVHIGTSGTMENSAIYRMFVLKIDENDAIILKLQYGHMTINKLSHKEITDLKERGYIR